MTYLPKPIDLSAVQVEWLGGRKALSHWLVAAAAIVPELGVEIRAAFAVFELSRSASLFAANYDGLVRVASGPAYNSANLSATPRHIPQDERFLEEEYSEWLRPVRDSEWFL